MNKQNYIFFKSKQEDQFLTLPNITRLKSINKSIIFIRA